MFRFIRVMMLICLLAPIGCEQQPADRTPGKVTSEDVRRDVGQAVNTVSDYSQNVRDVFQKKLEAQINELDSKIVQLRMKGRDLKDNAKADWDQKMAELEAKLDAARAKQAELRQSSADVWNGAKRAAESAYDDVDKAFRDASKEL